MNEKSIELLVTKVTGWNVILQLWFDSDLNIFICDFDLNHLTFIDFDVICKSVFDTWFAILI